MDSYNNITEATNAFIHQGFTEKFKATQEGFQALKSKKNYRLEDLTIVASHKFDTDGKSSELLAIEATDGTKGLLITGQTSKKKSFISNLISH